MSYEAKVFNVMIASPGDLVAEREIIQQCIHTWNANHSEHRRIVLLPLRWESHSSPEMGAHPQAIINRQVLDKADLLVGLFWKRIGTKTEHFISGTVEEIETHSKSGKPTMVYFSDLPVSPSETDAQQYAAVQEYQIELRPRGLYNNYKTVEEFKEKFTNHLTQTLNSHKLFSGTSVEDLPKPAPVGDVKKIYVLASDMGSELRSFREITGEKLFRITGKYGLSRFGVDANKLAPEAGAMFRKERHQWFDELTKEYIKRFDPSFKKLIQLISDEETRTPAFRGYAEPLKIIPKGLDDMMATINHLTDLAILARDYVNQ